MNQKPSLYSLNDETGENHIGHGYGPSHQDHEPGRKPFSIEKNGNDQNDQSQRDGTSYLIGFFPKTSSRAHRIQAFDRHDGDEKRSNMKTKVQIVLKGEVENSRNEW